MRTSAARPYEGHLLLAVTRVRMQANLTRQLTKLAREVDQPLPARGATAGGDALALRGIPCVGRGVSGARRETRPEAVLERLDREFRLLASLVRDIPGTSPGTDPAEALFGEVVV